MKFFKNKRARKRFKECHNLFINKINRLGFFFNSNDYYICGKYNITVINTYSDNYDYIGSRIVLDIGDDYVHQTIFIFQDFYDGEDDKHDDMINYIMNMGVFSRKLKIDKIMNNEVFQ